MNPEIPDPAYAAELLDRQQTLQSQAASVLEDLDLLPTLSRVGTPQQIGSCASGLMVWRDIDCNVVSPGLGLSAAFDIVRLLAAHPRISKMRYFNESGKFNPTGEPRDERYYMAFFYAPDRGEEWKIDISFWLNDLPRSEVDDLRTMQKQLTPVSRLAILWIKDVWHRLPAYRTQVGSMDIYDAVLNHQVQTPAGFDVYLAQRGKPTRSP